MKKILIATHGKLADGFASSLKILLNKTDIQTINAYLDDENEDADYISQINSFIDSLQPDDEGVIFTDIYGGSVNQKVIQAVVPSTKSVVVITQTNLAIVLQVSLATAPLTNETIASMISESTPQNIDINKIRQDSPHELEDFF